MRRTVIETAGPLRGAASKEQAVRACFGILLSFSLGASSKPAGAAPYTVQSLDELTALRTKQLVRRLPEAQAQIDKVKQKVQSLKQSDGALAALTEDCLTETIMSAGSLSEDRLREQVEFLSDLAGPRQTLPEADKIEAASRYEHVCASLDDQIFIKQLDDALVRHDRLIQHIRFQLWGKEKVASELAAIEESIARAQPLPYGRLELLRGLAGKKIAAPPNGCYLGACGEPYLLSNNRPAAVGLEEAQGMALAIEEICPSYCVKSAGQFADFDKANSSNGQFLPPLTLVAKTRLLEGRIPAFTLSLENSKNSAGKSSDSICVQDILDGKLDEYLTRNFKLLAAANAPVLIGLFDSFDHASESAFGSDGRTPYYLLLDPKLNKLAPDKQKEEAARHASKGAYLKSTADLNKYYGDASAPDGPERVRDAWKRIREIATKCGASSVSFFASAGPGHGDRKLLASGCAAEDWNQLKYYWPGEAVIDWLALAPTEFPTGKKTAAGDFAADFLAQAHGSLWQGTPLALLKLEPPGRDALAEEKWLSACFQEFVPAVPAVKACVLGYPGNLLLWSPEAAAAARRGIISNSYYKQKLKLLNAKQ
jgi:hypothetical protein